MGGWVVDVADSEEAMEAISSHSISNTVKVIPPPSSSVIVNEGRIRLQ